MGEKMSENMEPIKPLKSEIINKKKQLILKVDQTSDFVYPNELYKYQIYCKNVSGDTIEDVHIQILNPTTISINEDDSIPPEGINIGDLNNGQSHLLYVKARCSTTGKFTVHFMCFGEESELVTKPLTILSDYDSYNDQTIHKIHIYNFTPYEEKFELHSQDYNNDVTQLIKKQKLPSKRTEKAFMISSEDINNNIIADESQNYIDQANILYGDPYNSDEHNYQYIEKHIGFDLLNKLYEIDHYLKEEMEKFDNNISLKNAIKSFNKQVIDDIKYIIENLSLYIGISNILNIISEKNKNAELKEYKELITNILFEYRRLLMFLEPAKISLSNKILKNESTFQFMNLKGDIINLQKCEICEKKFESNDLILIFKCKHLYHSLCVKKEGSNKYECPICSGLEIEQTTFNNFSNKDFQSTKPIDKRKIMIKLEIFEKKFEKQRRKIYEEIEKKKKIEYIFRK